MHKARAFFNVCGGLLLLTIAYAFGIRTASGQSGSVVEAAGVFGPQGTGVLAVSGRVVYLGDWNGQTQQVLPPVPGTSRVVTITWAVFDTWLALLENGDYYQCNREGTTWTRLGNVFGGGATPAQAESWGALKSRYHSERGAGQPAQQDR